MKYRARVLALLLTATMTAGTLPAPAYAAEVTEAETQAEAEEPQQEETEQKDDSSEEETDAGKSEEKDEAPATDEEQDEDASSDEEQDETPSEEQDEAADEQDGEETQEAVTFEVSGEDWTLDQSSDSVTLEEKAYEAGETAVDKYTVTLPEGAEKVTLTFSGSVECFGEEDKKLESTEEDGKTVVADVEAGLLKVYAPAAEEDAEHTLLYVIQINAQEAAQDLAVAADKEEVASGEDVTLDWTIGQDLTDMGGLQVRLYFDADLFELKDAKTGESNADAELSALKKDADGNSFYELLYVYDYAEDSSSELKAGSILTTTFTAKYMDEETADAEFRLETVEAFDTEQQDVELTLGDVETVQINNAKRPEYAVKLGKGITGDSTVEHGKDYQFRISETEGMDYVIEATMNGEPVDVIANGDGTYTIKDVRGDLEIKATATAKMMAVTLDGEDLSGADSVAYNGDYTFNLNRAAGYDYEVSVTTADGSEVAYTMDETGTVGTVKNVVSSLTIKAIRTAKTYAVTVTGNGAEDVFANPATATHGKKYTFRIGMDESLTYRIEAQIGENVYNITPVSGQCAIAASLVTGDVTIRVTRGYLTHLGEGIKGDSIAENEGDYEFRIDKDPSLNYDIKATMDETSVDFEEKEDGVYIIKNVTGELQISMTTAIKTFEVTLESEDLSGETVVNYGADYTFRLDKEKGYIYTLTVTADGEEVPYEASEADNTYVVKNVTSDLSVRVTKVLEIPYKVEIEDQEYSGSALKPQVKVVDIETNKELVQGKDYTVTYKNNVNANSVRDENGDIVFSNTVAKSTDAEDFQAENPYVVITGKGNYQQTVYANFNICLKYIGMTTIAVTDKFEVSEKTVKVLKSVKNGKLTLKEGTDYTVFLTVPGGDPENPEDLVDIVNGQTKLNQSGEYILTIEGKGNYAGTVKESIFVDKKAQLINNATVKLNVKSVPYDADGAVLDPDQYVVTIKDGKTTKTLKFDEDYTVSFYDNEAVGTAKMQINGKGDYTGYKVVTYQITGTKLTTSNVQISDLDSTRTYTGSEIKQDQAKLTLKGDTDALVRNKDYTVSYTNHVKKGTATITFTGKAEAGYTGSIKKTFKIEAADLSDCTKENMDAITIVYAKAGADPTDAVKLTYKGKTLVNGQDYTLKFQNNKAVASASDAKAPTITITGKGNFAGKLTQTFSITAKTLTASDITIVPVAYNAKKADTYKYQPKVVVKDGGKVLGKADYKITWDNNTQKDYNDWYADESGTKSAPSMTIEGIGAYTGTVTMDLPIYRTKLAAANLYVMVEGTDYTGKQVTPAVAVFYSTDKKAISEVKKDAGKLETYLKAGKLMLLDEEDYEVTYGANIDAGKDKGTVTITGINEYGGSVTQKFTINSKTMVNTAK